MNYYMNSSRIRRRYCFVALTTATSCTAFIFFTNFCCVGIWRTGYLFTNILADSFATCSSSTNGLALSFFVGGFWRTLFRIPVWSWCGCFPDKLLIASSYAVCTMLWFWTRNRTCPFWRLPRTWFCRSWLFNYAIFSRNQFPTTFTGYWSCKFFTISCNFGTTSIFCWLLISFLFRNVATLLDATALYGISVRNYYKYRTINTSNTINQINNSFIFIDI